MWNEPHLIDEEKWGSEKRDNMLQVSESGWNQATLTLEPTLVTTALASAALYVKVSLSDLQGRKLGPGDILCLLS